MIHSPKVWPFSLKKLRKVSLTRGADHSTGGEVLVAMGKVGWKSKEEAEWTKREEEEWKVLGVCRSKTFRLKAASLFIKDTHIDILYHTHLSLSPSLPYICNNKKDLGEDILSRDRLKRFKEGGVVDGEWWETAVWQKASRGGWPGWRATTDQEIWATSVR